MTGDPSSTMTLRAVFLDRDGVINALCADPLTGALEGPLSVSDVQLLSGVTRDITRLQLAGYLIVGVTNQPSAAKGFISEEEQEAIHERVLHLLARDGVVLDDWRICPHHPEAVVAEFALDCACRKPKPGMLLDAAEYLRIDLAQSWMIGDSDSDVEAGIAAGTRTAIIGAVNSHKRRNPDRATLHCDDLAGVVEAIIGGPTAIS